MNGYPIHDECGGLLMMPYEAGMPTAAGVDGVAFCARCSPSRGLVVPGEKALERARAASIASGATEHVGELRESYFGKGARVALARAVLGDVGGAKRKRHGFTLCKSFMLVNDDGTATEAGREFANRIGLVLSMPEEASVAMQEQPIDALDMANSLESVLAVPLPGPVDAPAAKDGPRPFLRWCGGKSALLPDILAAMPEKFGRLLVPFVGGGALVLALPGRVSYISDANTHLVNAYTCIRDSVEDVIAALQDHKNDRDYYDGVVEAFNDGYGDPIWRAAAFLYMNRVGFNGVCRYNLKGGYNVPFGDNPKATICDAENLRACAAALHNVEIVAEDFRAVEERAQPGDLVYLDPPYVPETKTANFTGYWGKWGDDEHEACAALFSRLTAKRVHVLASNSDTPMVRRLYAGFEMRDLQRANSVNSKASARGGKRELLILGGTWTPGGST